MKKVLKFVLCAIIGCIVSFVLMLINDSLHILITCALAAFCVASLLYYRINSDTFKKVISVLAFILTFFIYFLLMNKVDDETLNIWWILLYWGPYVIYSHALFQK